MPENRKRTNLMTEILKEKSPLAGTLKVVGGVQETGVSLIKRVIMKDTARKTTLMKRIK